MRGTLVSNRTIPISLLMKLVALIALNLAILRMHSFLLHHSPLPLFALVTLDLVIIQCFIRHRPLGASHYTFLIVGLVASWVVHMVFLNGFYGAMTGMPTTGRPSRGYLAITDRWVTNTLGVLLAWVSARDGTRGQTPAARSRRTIPAARIILPSALIGLGVFAMVFITLNSFCSGTTSICSGHFACLVQLGLASFRSPAVRQPCSLEAS